MKKSAPGFAGMLAIMLPWLVLVTSARSEEPSADRVFAEAHGWIYDDLDRGFAIAATAGRPLMVVLRCPP